MEARASRASRHSLSEKGMGEWHMQGATCLMARRKETELCFQENEVIP